MTAYILILDEQQTPFLICVPYTVSYRPISFFPFGHPSCDGEILNDLTKKRKHRRYICWVSGNIFLFSLYSWLMVYWYICSFKDNFVKFEDIASMLLVFSVFNASVVHIPCGNCLPWEKFKIISLFLEFWNLTVWCRSFSLFKFFLFSLGSFNSEELGLISLENFFNYLFVFSFFTFYWLCFWNSCYSNLGPPGFIF